VALLTDTERGVVGGGIVGAPGVHHLPRVHPFLMLRKKQQTSVEVSPKMPTELENLYGFQQKNLNQKGQT
jgi:hypothetical protein